jgi:hypothetical protein
MPSRSLPRLPPRSPLDRRAAARRAGLDALAGRAGSRHGHPLPDTQDNKAEQPAETRAVCQLPENEHDRKSGAAASSSRTTLRGAGGSPGAARRQVIQIPAGCARTRRRPLSFPGFPDDLMCPGFPGSRVLVMLRAGSGWLDVRIRSGRACPAMSDSRAGSAGTDPGVPGGGRYPAPSRRPRGLPAGKASRIHRGPGPAGRHTGRAGRLTAENLAASSRQSRCARGHPLAPAEPRTARSARVTGSRAGHAPRPGCSPSRTRWPGGEAPAAG